MRSSSLILQKRRYAKDKNSKPFDPDPTAIFVATTRSEPTVGRSLSPVRDHTEKCLASHSPQGAKQLVAGPRIAVPVRRSSLGRRISKLPRRPRKRQRGNVGRRKWGRHSPKALSKPSRPASSGRCSVPTQASLRSTGLSAIGMAFVKAKPSDFHHITMYNTTPGALQHNDRQGKQRNLTALHCEVDIPLDNHAKSIYQSNRLRLPFSVQLCTSSTHDLAAPKDTDQP
ncbi:uncharacterized protein LY79DRAFT_558623 [Colletotrichum navitas]|uniref:Uncharacterized protein n=1 Tax=Colletotrichum navitas TaxID=681940 RepID=A0AAD8V1L0_9PEZI|nr:uncharacterized protein LY79DRAFT_558623 [Colletotrichum navitas]KAK1585456.1 hypothetical protein LY79DRAFT_558623 [Colletotrichum navitas]